MKKQIRDALKRALDLAWHPSVRWRRLYNYEVRYPRYPSPASEPIDNNFHHLDYKTPYRESVHHIRHLNDNPVHDKQIVLRDPLRETPVQKLVRLKMIKPEDVNNTEVVEAAKQKYEKIHNEPLENKVYLNEIEEDGFDQLIKNDYSRESMAFFVRDYFNAIKDMNEQQPIMNDFEDLYHPEIEEIKHIDMFSNDPVFRQLILDEHWLLNQITARNGERKYQEFFKGDPNYWHALDNSFSPENINRVQSSIKDKISNLETTALAEVHNKHEAHPTEKKPFPIQSKFYPEHFGGKE